MLCSYDYSGDAELTVGDLTHVFVAGCLVRFRKEKNGMSRSVSMLFSCERVCVIR